MPKQNENTLSHFTKGFGINRDKHNGTIITAALALFLFSASIFAPIHIPIVIANSDQVVNGKILASSQSTIFSPPFIFAIDPYNKEGGFGVCSQCDSAHFTPDGRKIIYGSINYGAGDQLGVFVADVNSTNNGIDAPRQLTNSSSHAGQPILSPDGRKIAFTEGNFLNVMDFDGGNVRRIADLTNSTAPWPIEWSPDGSKILLLTTVVVNNTSIKKDYVINSDGTGQTLLNDVIWNQDARWSPDGTKILLVGVAPGDSSDNAYSIFTVNSDGSGRTRLVDRIGEARWSPDGKKIAFESHKDGATGIYTMNADGSDITNLTNATRDGLFAGSPIWSPDGTKIAFAGIRANDTSLTTGGIYIMSAADGSGQLLVEGGFRSIRPLEWGSEKQAEENARSDNVGKIAFVSDRDGNNEIYVMNDDGTNQTRLTHDNADDIGPNWSPDGSKIAFLSNRTGSYGLYTMNSDGSDLNKLADSSSQIGAWSPDSTRIAFTKNVDGNSEIYVANSDGTGATNLTNNPAFDDSPTWSPDGTKLAFSTNRDDRWQILIMNADGSGNLTSIPGAPGQVLSFGAGLSWSPDGTKFAFLWRGTVFGFPHLDIIKSDGSSLPFPSNIATWSAGFDWSPDGTKLVSDNGINPQSQTLTILDLTNGNTTDLFPRGSLDGGGVWSPDGSKIAFPSHRDGNYEVYTMNSDGTNQTRLTFNTASDWGADWVSISNTSSHSTSELKVNTVDLVGNPISGIWTTVKSMNGILLKSGYTPFAFTGNPGAEYKVTAENFDGKAFSRWVGDRGAPDKNHAVTLPADGSTITLTAIYDTGDSLRGFTPLTHAGTADQPALTLVSKLLDDSSTNDLHMYAIIDPVAMNASSATYIAYAGDYQNLVFDHWDDGNTNRVRTLTIEKPTTITAYYKIQ